MRGDALDRTTGLVIRVQEGPPVRLVVTGEIDLANYAQLVDGVLDRAPRDDPWVLDMSGVTYADSTAIRALVSFQERFGDRFTLVPGARLGRILEVTGLSARFGLAPCP